MFNFIKLFFPLLFAGSLIAADAVIEINTNEPLVVSQFELGVTHTHYFWEFGHANAVDLAKALLTEKSIYQNQHIMGWGAGNPEPSPGEFYWDDLDRRVELMRSLDAKKIITLCTAPGWMKEGGDWDMETRISDDSVDDFAALCAEIAARYTDVEYFQVWNEFKGYWSSALNNWDYVRYTDMYNKVYEAVKEVRPDAKIGGPYLVIQGDGGSTIGKSGRDTYKPIGSKDWQVINYWLENKTGADFFCFDYGLIDYHDTNKYTFDEQMQLTVFFGDIVRQLREKTDLPIFVSEYYAGSDSEDQYFTAANHASCYYHSIINGTNLGLIWNPEQGELDNYLFTDTETAEGGEPTPHFYVFAAINEYFCAGTQLYKTTSSSPNIEVLASAEKTMLINKSGGAVNIEVNGSSVHLAGYEVLVIDTPENPSGIKSGNKQAPDNIELGGNYPNPFNPVTQISYSLKEQGQVELAVFNVLGGRVKTLVRDTMQAGSHQVVWDGTDSAGKEVGSGIFIYQLLSGNLLLTRKMLLMR